jgi:hypothetical protein
MPAAVWDLTSRPGIRKQNLPIGDINRSHHRPDNQKLVAGFPSARTFYRGSHEEPLMFVARFFLINRCHEERGGKLDTLSLAGTMPEHRAPVASR